MNEWQLIETAPRDGTWILGRQTATSIPYVMAFDNEPEEGDQEWFTFNLQYEEVVGKLTGKKWEPLFWAPITDVPDSIAALSKSI